MAAKYRKVDPRIWVDERFRSLDAEGRLLALWMLTTLRLTRCGIILWSKGLASEETGIDHARIDTVCHTVCDTLNWVLDMHANCIFLCKWWRYNAPDNAKALQGALTDLHDVPGTGLKSALVLAAKDLPADMRAAYLSCINTVYDTVSDTVSAQEQEQEQYQEQEQEQDKYNAQPEVVHHAQPSANGAQSKRKRKRKPNREYPPDFLAFWNAFPAGRRQDKPRALEAFEAAVESLRNDDTIEGSPAEYLAARAADYAASDQGRGPYVRGPAPWLNQQGWDDPPEAWAAKRETRPQALESIDDQIRQLR